MKPKKNENLNSPENLLAPWMLANMRRHFEIGNKGTVALGKWLLAGILGFAETHNKLIEMYQWIDSPQGRKFFSSCDPEGHYVLEALRGLDAKGIDISRLQGVLEKYIEKNFYQFKYELKLR